MIASMASLTSELFDLDSTELDKLVHSLEFENQQCVKMIERKNQVISSLSSQIDNQIQEKNRLENEICKFDEDTKRLHRNYTNNRDNIACLKNTMSVMSDHISALSKQVSVLQAKTVEESKAFNEHLSNYTKTRDEYMAKYRAFPLAITLEEAQKTVLIHQDKVKNIAENKKSIAEQINSFEAELSNQVMTRIVVKIVQTKINTRLLETEIHECVREKTMLLEQLKELQKFKQQDMQDTANNSKAVSENMNRLTNNDINQGETCSGKIDAQNNLINDMDSMCIEDTSVENQQEATVGKDDCDVQEKSLQEVSKDSEKGADIDNNGDVIMVDNNALSHFSDRSLHLNATIKSSLSETTKLTTRGSSLPLKEKQDRNSLYNSKQNVSITQNLSHKMNPGLQKPRLSIPRLPTISRLSPALHVPSLTVPRPSRVQQPRVTSLAQRKLLLPVSTPDFPEIKQPIPPPPRLLTHFNSTAQAVVNPLKGVSSLASLKPKQFLKATDDRTSQSAQKEQFNIQHKLSLTNDVSPPGDGYNDPTVLGVEKERQPSTNTNYLTNSSEVEEKDMQVGQNEATFTSTPIASDGDINADNEPLFRLDHTFGSQGSLDKSVSSQKSVDNAEILLQPSHDTNGAIGGSKPEFMTQLAGFTSSNPLSPDEEADRKDTNQKSFFSHFNISQKSAGADDGKEPDEGDGFTSVFSLINFGASKSDNATTENATTSQEWSGALGLLGMTSTDNNSEEVADSEPFSFNFGSSKGTEEENGNQGSFFSFGGSSFNMDYSEKPVFNLF